MATARIGEEEVEAEAVRPCVRRGGGDTQVRRGGGGRLGFWCGVATSAPFIPKPTIARLRKDDMNPLLTSPNQFIPEGIEEEMACARFRRGSSEAGGKELV
uniref:Uncharacterized protein n=1 Tax=Oryza nivara TaxID=4536 RepID=A0A0E0HD98_ORYNI